MTRLFPVTGALAFAFLCVSQSRADYRDKVLADRPALYWSFDETRSGAFSNAVDGGFLVTTDGPVETVDGPQSGSFPDFNAKNQALRVVPKAPLSKVVDSGEESLLDFGLGDTITVEAWVRCEKINDGQQVYIIGKGRTQNSGVPANNQNWALRLRGQGGLACASFLFRDERNRTDSGDEDWHRWTTTSGFKPGAAWHHVVVTYTFGKPDSARGYLDGRASEGAWDMGGATILGPVVDNDEVWIGTSMGRSPNATLTGAIDEIAIYRHALNAERIKAHFVRKDGTEGAAIAKVSAPTKGEPQGDPVPPPVIKATDLPSGMVRVEVFEHPGQGEISAASEFVGGNDSKPAKDLGGLNASWSNIPTLKTDEYTDEAFGLGLITNKYDERGIRADRSRPFLVRISGTAQLPAGKQQLLLRSLGGARLSVDGAAVVQTDLHKANYADTESVPDQAAQQLVSGLSLLPPGHHEAIGSIESDGKPHVFVIEAFAGGKSIRPELGELFAAVSSDGKDYQLLTPGKSVNDLSEAAWKRYVDSQRTRVGTLNAERRQIPTEDEYWQQRHEIARAKAKPAPAIPSTGDKNPIDAFLAEKLIAAKATPSALIDDAGFLRRLTLDTTGLLPTGEEVASFLADQTPDKRAKAIDRLLADARWADRWTPYWQDVLAENPNMLKGTLNNTGPFRWWIHEAMVDNKPMDRFVTELVLMRGSAQYGGPAGFGLATQNDFPMAAKAQILSSAFLGMEMKCARCHDAPNHPFNQGDLFSIAAMLQRGSIKVPETSLTKGLSVNSHVTVSLKAGETIEPHWPLTELPPEPLDGVLRNPKDPREMLASILTDPRNERFAQVIVNRLWKELIGIGIVDPVDDWESAAPSHKDLLRWLGHELVTHDYDQKYIARLILNSRLYQGVPTAQSSRLTKSTERIFEAPARRRMTAEELVDTLYQVAGKTFDVEQLTTDPEARQDANAQGNLGVPRRAWEFASLSNERDRPALAKPQAQVITDLLTTFGWREARAEPRSTRDHEANVLQPALLANGTAGARIVCLSNDSAFTILALQDQPLASLVQSVFLRVLSRPPTQAEERTFTELLEPGYAARRTGNPAAPKRPRITKAVSWANHLNPEATEVMLAVEKQVKAGDPPTPQLTAGWRERMEDALWALMLSPEFIHLP